MNPSHRFADRRLIALVKGAERYIFAFDDTDEGRQKVLIQFGIYAADHELSFTWYDAAVLSQKVKQDLPAAS